MSFPHPNVLNAFLEQYKEKRQHYWNSFTGFKWFASFNPWTTHEAPDAKKEICNKLSRDITAPIPDGKSEFDKWVHFCITLGELSTETLRKNKNSVLVNYLNAIRTYILSKIRADEVTRHQLDQFITTFNTSSEEKNEKKTDSEKTLLHLAYLGDAKSIVEAQQKKLFSYYPVNKEKKLIFFEENYFNSTFFNEHINAEKKFATFDEFEASIKILEEKPVPTEVTPTEKKETPPITPPKETPLPVTPVIVHTEGKEAVVDAMFPPAPPVTATPTKSIPVILFSKKPSLIRIHAQSDNSTKESKSVNFKEPIAELRLFTVPEERENTQPAEKKRPYNLRRRPR